MGGSPVFCVPTTHPTHSPGLIWPVHSAHTPRRGPAVLLPEAWAEASVSTPHPGLCSLPLLPAHCPSLSLSKPRPSRF